MAVELEGRTSWSLTVDDEGYREYRLVHTVRVSDPENDGPFAVYNCPGLPVPGAPWSFGGDDDPWVWCRPAVEVRPVTVNSKEAVHQWEVEHTFSNRPTSRNDPQRCQETQPEDPLLEPAKLYISHVRYTEEAQYDRFGFAVTNSAFEPLRGPQVEFDANRLQVRVVMNVSDLELDFVALFIDCVNDAPLWGFLRRCVKLSDMAAEPHTYGQCYRYWTISLTFDTNANTFDRDILDEGTKVIQGAWNATTGAWDIADINGEPADPNNPAHFMRAVDRQNNPCRLILDGSGSPAEIEVAVSEYVSVASGNQNNALTNTSYWRPLVSKTPSPWNASTAYAVGAVVYTTAGSTFTWLCIQANTGQDPTAAGAFWTLLPNGLLSKGPYSTTTIYGLGDYVTSGGASPGAGRIHVEKYLEVNFLALGIPPVLQ